MKNILVPTDFSACSKSAANAAYLLAQRFGAKLHLFTSLGLPRNWEEKTEDERRRDEGAMSVIRKSEGLLAKMELQFTDVPVRTAYGVGIPWRSIDKYIREHGIDLVVMGSHGKSGKSEFFIGSNTQKVVRTVHCPVLVIKNPIDGIDFQKVVFASDFSESEMPAFKHFIDFIKHFVPEVHLVSIHTSPFDMPYPVLIEAMKPFEAACTPLVCKSHVYRDLSIDEGIRTFAREISAGLIAISNLERSPLKRMLVGSNVEMLVNHADLPVLTIDFEQKQEG